MKKSKWLSWVIVCCMMISSSVFTASAETREVKAEDDYTLGEVRDILQEYFIENNIDISPNTEEYYTYLLKQQIEGSDENLKTHPDYNLIITYGSVYRYKYSKIIQDNYTITMIGEIFNKTIGDIKSEIIQDQLQIQNEYNSLPQGIISNRIAGYNATNAVAYARKWANDYNVQYGYMPGNWLDSLIGVGADCTNFASQCLVAGGLPMVVRPNYSSQPARTIDTNGSYWYSKDNGQRVSASFVRINAFYPYWNTKVQTYSTQSKETMKSLVSPGDVVLLVDSSTDSLSHAIIITYKSGNTVKYSAHSWSRLDVDVNTIDDNTNDYKIIDFT